jgi:hypothetical protein
MLPCPISTEEGCSCAVHVATTDWDAKRQRPETTFLLRKEYELAAGREADVHLDQRRDYERTRSTVRIIGAETLEV